MSDQSTNRMIAAYLEQAVSPMFLTSMFQSPAENFHATEKIELDIERDTEEVAIAITASVQDGYRNNETTKYVNKSFTPPIFNEMATISGNDLMKRMPGRTPFEDPVFLADAMKKSFRVYNKLEKKVRRAVELMASQLLTTGTLTLTDSGSNTLYTINFSPKSGHFVTTTPWATDGTTGDPIDDIAGLAVTLRRDGKQVPDQIIFGANGAWPKFLNNATVKQYLGRLGYGLGQVGNGVQTAPVDPAILIAQSGGVAPSRAGVEGATYYGRILINNYIYECWGYDAFYMAPNGGAFTPYVADNKVIVRASKGRLDLSFGAIPILSRDPRVEAFLPARISGPAQQVDLTPNAWLSLDGRTLNVSAGTRPMTIPTAIDTFGCLTVS